MSAGFVGRTVYLLLHSRKGQNSLGDIVNLLSMIIFQSKYWFDFLRLSTLQEKHKLYTLRYSRNKTNEQRMTFSSISARQKYHLQLLSMYIYFLAHKKRKIHITGCLSQTNSLHKCLSFIPISTCSFLHLKFDLPYSNRD